MSKIDVDNRIAAGMSLANHVLRQLVLSQNAVAQVVESPRTKRANLLRKQSGVWIGRSKRRFLAAYALNAKALRLFAGQVTPEFMRANWRDYCRGYVYFEIDGEGNASSLDSGFTARSQRELLRPFSQPLTLAERHQLFALLRGSRDARLTSGDSDDNIAA